MLRVLRCTRLISPAAASRMCVRWQRKTGIINRNANGLERKNMSLYVNWAERNAPSSYVGAEDSYVLARQRSDLQKTTQWWMVGRVEGAAMPGAAQNG